MAQKKELVVEIKTDNRQLKTGIASSKKELKKFKGEVDKTSKGMSGLAKGAALAGGAIVAAFAVQGITMFASKVFQVTGEFQKLEAVLTNTLGSNSKAQKALSMITKFAAETPFSVLELSDSFVRLANQGFTPTAKEMRKLGDLAASTGKDFNMLAEGILDATTFEFERLKEFGIKASQQGDKVKLTFKGVTTTIDKTNDAVRGYILSLGDLKGVSGAMAAISETLTGKTSNLGDAYDTLAGQIGKLDSDGVVGGAITGLSKLLEITTNFLKSNAQIGREDALNTLGDKELAAIQKYIGFAKERENIDKQLSQLLHDKVEMSKAINRVNPIATMKEEFRVESSIAFLKQKLLLMADFENDAQEESNKLVATEIKRNKIKIKQLETITSLGVKSRQTDFTKITPKNSSVTTPGIATTNQQMEDFIAKGGNDNSDITDRTKAYEAQAAAIGLVGAATAAMVQIAIEGDNDTIKSISKVIIALLAEASAKQLAASSALGPVGIAVGLASIGVLAGIFNGLINSFAEGGMVQGAQLAIVGDNPSGREFIVPSEKLDSFVAQHGGGNKVEVFGRLDGKDILISSQRADNFINR